MENIRVGVAGPGRIVRRVMKDFFRAKGVELIAIASRSEVRARQAAAEYGAKYAFSSYEQMAECQEVDLVYIATPHPFHCPIAILMMEHGKHVICEKPISVSEEQTRRMAECARKNGVFLMEAMWTRFFPAAKKLKEFLDAGEIGRITHIYSTFSCVAEENPESRLFDPELAGGALLDIGVYPLMAVTQILGWNPERVQCLNTKTGTGVDARMSVQMQYACGATAQIMTALDASAPSHLLIYGTKGHVAAEEFWHMTEFCVAKLSGDKCRYEFPAENEGFRYEFEEAARCIREGLSESPLMTLEESIAVSRITESLRRKAGVIYPFERQ